MFVDPTEHELVDISNIKVEDNDNIGSSEASNQ